MANPDCLISPPDEELSLELDAQDEAGASAPSVPLAETLFVRLLRLERRRTERSGKPFLLVLIRGSEIQVAAHPPLANTISTALSSRMRETDILGWYKQNETLALLTTEFGEATVDVSVAAIALKVSVALENALGLEAYRRLTVEYRIFPQTPADGLRDTGDTTLYPDLSDRHEGHPRKRAVKRLMDIIGSVIALIAFSPVFALIALLVKLTSKGPILFCQTRVGQYHRNFVFLKFRTMYVDNDPGIHKDYVAKLIAGKEDTRQDRGFYKLVNDPRVTPLGRILRKTSLDELPQFVNVLLNDMSLVGPRPPLPYEYNLYRPWHQRRVTEIKPGITGLWQIKGRSLTTFDEMVRMDLRYSRVGSAWLDLKILLQTPAAMFSGRGAC